MKTPWTCIVGVAALMAPYHASGQSLVTAVQTASEQGCSYGAVAYDVAVNPETGLVYVPDGYSKTLSVLSVATNAVVQTVQVGAAWGVGVNVPTNHVYMSRDYTRTYIKIDGGDGAVTYVQLPNSSPNQWARELAVNSATDRVYVSSTYENKVMVFDGTNNTLVATIPVNGWVTDLDVDEALNRVYVTDSQTKTLTVVDGATNTVLASVPVSDYTYSVAHNPVSNKIYVTEANISEVVVLDRLTLNILKRIPVPDPHGVAVNVSTNRVYVSKYFGGLYVFDGNNDSLAAYLDLPLHVTQKVAVDEALGRVYVSGGGLAGGVCTPQIAVVQDVATPFDVSAGPDQVVEEGATVQLDGTTSAPNPAYAWEQIIAAPPGVALSGDTTAAPSFVAPWLAGGVNGNQTLTFKLTVTANGRSESDTVNVLVQNMNHAPEASAGSLQIVREGSVVSLDGTASFDPDGDPYACSWTQSVGDPVDLQGADTCAPSFTAPQIPGGFGADVSLGFTLTVSDSRLLGQATTTITVQQLNHAPVANAGPPQTVGEATAATLNGTLSSDPDGDVLSYQWTQLSGDPVVLSNPTTATPTFVAPRVAPGGETLTFHLVVGDGGGLSGEAAVAITVQNVDDPPSCELGRPNVALLWPPNHKIVPLGIVGVTDPQKDNVVITVTGITQDEPVNGLGDGDTAPDGALDGAKALLRVERAGEGNGRVYRVTFTADDGRGEACSGAVTVGVPRSAKDTPVDDGQRYDSTRP